MVQDLDRILDGDDVDRLDLVDVVDQGGDGCRLSGTGGSRDQHHASRLFGQPRRDRWQPQRLERRRAREHAAEHEADRSALAEDVDAETAQPRDAVGEVRLRHRHELVRPVLRHDREGHPLGIGGRDAVERSRLQMAVDTHVRLLFGDDQFDFTHTTTYATTSPT